MAGDNESRQIRTVEQVADAAAKAYNSVVVRNAPGQGPPGSAGFKPGVVYRDPGDLAPHPVYGRFVVCETCRVPLTRLMDVDGGIVWLHTQNWNHYDHVPIPAAGTETDQPNSICDFHGDTAELTWVFTGDRIQVPLGDTLHDYGANWSACNECAELIRAQDYQGLLRRALRLSQTARDAHARGERFTGGETWMPLWRRFIPSIYKEQYIGPRLTPTKLTPHLMPKIQLGLLKFWRHPNLLGQLNDRTPGTHVSIPGVHLGREDEFLIRHDYTQKIPAEGWSNHVDHLTAGLLTAELFWISTNFTRLAIMAGKDLGENLEITREEIPSPFGLMVFEEPIGEIPRPGGNAQIRAVSWTLVPAGVWINLYIQVEDSTSTGIDPVELRHEFGYLLCLNAGSGFVFGQPIAAAPGRELWYMHTIFATWFLMAQPGVADQSSAPVDKKYSRAFQREHNRKLPAVRLVDLRKRPRRSSSPEHESGTGRTLTERIFRRGHWKRQAYGPKRGMRKMIYVSPYIAGPEDAPLRERPPIVKILR